VPAPRIQSVRTPASSDGSRGRRLRRLLRPRRRPVTALLAASLTAPLVTGCSLLSGPQALKAVSSASMTVASPVFGADMILPLRYTCRGARLSPPLYWSGAPAPQTKSFAIVVDDSQAPITPYIYWLVFNIGATTTAIPENGVPPGAVQAQNSSGKLGYDPPCPSGRHDMYRFTVYALNARLSPRVTSLRAVWSAIAQHAIASGRLTARAAE